MFTTRRTILSLILIGAAAAHPSAQRQNDRDVSGRAKGAERVVVATVLSVTPAFDTNKFGDRLIVSHAELRVDEALKGPAAQVVGVDVEGGTIGNLTLTVSDMPLVAPGDRAVFFLDQARPGVHVPHDRGKGILKLTRSNQVVGDALSLADVKLQVQLAAQGQK